MLTIDLCLVIQVTASNRNVFQMLEKILSKINLYDFLHGRSCSV